MYLLDTDVLIDVQRNFPAAVAWLSALTETPSIPGFVVMELIQTAANKRQVNLATQITSAFPIVWPTETDCYRALADYRIYHLSHNLGLVDALIAACAIGLSATLCTFNVKHYGVIPGLVTAQPYTW